MKCLILVGYVLSAFFAVAAILSRYFFQRGYKYFKGIPVALLIVMLIVLMLSSHVSMLPMLISLGLLFGLAGDIFLIDEGRYLVPGILSFSTGHIFYILSFFIIPFSINAGGVLMLVATISFLYVLKVGMRRSSKKALFIPVIFYSFILVAMNLFAQANDAATGGMGLLSLGAFMFLISDAILAWDFMIGGAAFLHVLILVSYYSAQLLISFYAVRHIISVGSL